MAKWHWNIDRGSVAYQEPKDWAGTGYDRDDMRECTIAIWSEYFVKCRLFIDGLTPSPSLYSCISGCMRGIIPSMRALDY